MWRGGEGENETSRWLSGNFSLAFIPRRAATQDQLISVTRIFCFCTRPSTAFLGRLDVKCASRRHGSPLGVNGGITRGELPRQKKLLDNPEKFRTRHIDASLHGVEAGLTQFELRISVEGANQIWRWCSSKGLVQAGVLTPTGDDHYAMFVFLQLIGPFMFSVGRITYPQLHSAGRKVRRRLPFSRIGD